MRFKSRFTIIGVLAAAALMLLTVVPAMATTATQVSLELATIDDESVGATPSDFVSSNDLANDRVQVEVHDNGLDGDGVGTIDVTVESPDDDIILRITEESGDNGHFGGVGPLDGIFTVVDTLDGNTPEFVAADSGAEIDISGGLVQGATLIEVDDGTTDDASFFSVGMKIEIEGELMRVTAVNLSTADITVTRGRPGGTADLAHADGLVINIVTSIFAADDGDEIDVAYGVRAAVTTVDAEAPSIDDEFPGDGSFLSANTILLGAEVTDSGVGLGDAVDVKANTVLEFVEGFPQSIIGQPDSVNDDDDPVFKVIYSLGLVEFVYDWELTIFDLVGNSTSDSFDLTVDRDDPRMLQATTGIAYDSDAKSTEADRNSIVIVFENTDAEDDEFLDKDSLDASDFVVENNEVTGIVFPNLEPGEVDDENGVDLSGVPGAGGGSDPANDESRHVVFLTLRDELEADEEPLVQILAAAVEDLAGNGNSAQSLDADDGIAPEFTITIDGEASSRPVVIGKADHEFTVTVTSDEPLDGDDPPAIYFLRLDDVSDVDVDSLGFFSDVEVEDVIAELSADPAGTNTWETEQEGDIFGDFSGLVVVFVVGTDQNGNENTSDGVDDPSGESPTAPEDNDLVDLDAADGDNALIEFDSLFADPVFGVRPETGDDTTESSNPFIVLDFSEGQEYSINIDADSDDAGIDGLDGPADKIDDIEIDTHDTVTLTSVELDGVDVSGQVGRRDDDSFVIALRDLAVGEYTLTCTAVDEVGNDIDADNCKFDFEVVERGDYEVPLDPGWNLVSLPGTPADPAIDSVLPSSMSASRVLQWVGGAFEVAERGDDGMWDPSGQITEITAGPGYWVFTTAFEDIETLIPERAPQTVLPTVDIVGGWNLVGIVDLAQAKAGDAPGDTEGLGIGEDEQDDFNVLPSAYFVSLTWSVAYSYDTTSGLWTKYTGVAGDGSVVNGKGYWIWATEAGTLVP